MLENDVVRATAIGVISRRETLVALTMPAATAIVGSSTRLDAAEPDPVTDEQVVHLSHFGFVGDGTHDDSAAWRAAIKVALQNNLRLIIVPWGVNGTSLVKTPICEGPLPSGLTFEGEARRHANPDQPGQRILYTGMGACWSITSGGSEPPTVGQWTWRYLTFEATDPAGTMFDFNAGDQSLLHDGIGSSYIVFVAFESCYLKGAGGGTRQTGDAIRATKTLSLYIDKQCQIRDWRRGVWLRGCDDCTIEGRLWLNARSIVHERSGSFGSNLQIRSNWLGRCPDATVEPGYILWDEGSGTAVHGTLFEGFDHGGIRQNERALVRLNGFGTTLIGCRFAEGRCLEIGPLAREVTLVVPGFASHLPQNDASIDAPYDWDFGFQQNDYRVLVVGASKNAVLHLGDHPRLVYRSRLPMGSEQPGATVPIDMEADQLADARGFRPRRRLLTAFNYIGKTVGTPANGGARMAPDPHSSQGWVITCAAKLPQAGIACGFVVGRDLQIGDTVRIAVRAACATPGWQLRVLRGDVDIGAAALSLGNARGFCWHDTVVDLSHWQVGDRLSVVVLNISGAHEDLRIDFIEVAIVSSVDVLALPHTPVSPVGTTESASCRSVNAAIDALSARIDALQAALRQSGHIT